MSLTSCIKKAGAALSAADKSEILDAARKYRKQGLSTIEAGKRAVDDQIAKVKAAIEVAMSPKPVAEAPAAQPEVDAVPAAQPVAEAPVATHKDPGEPAEPVTPAVVAEAITKAADKRDEPVGDIRAEALRLIDQAIANAPDDKIEVSTSEPRTRNGKTEFTAFKGKAGTNDYISVEVREGSDGNWTMHAYEGARSVMVHQFKGGSTAAARRSAESIMLGAAKEGTKTVIKPADKVTIKVPGDGQFTVVNNADRLREFRKLVERSPGFASSKKAKPRVEKAVSSGDLSPNSLAREMLDEGEPLNALEVLEAAGKPMGFGATNDGETPIPYTDVRDETIDGDAGFFSGHSWSAKKGESRWAVLDKTTGLSLGSGTTREAAISVAKSNIKKAGAIDKIAQARQNPKAKSQEQLRAEFREDAERKQAATFDAADATQARIAEMNQRERERDVFYQSIMGKDAKRPVSWRVSEGVLRDFLKAAETAGKLDEAVKFIEDVSDTTYFERVAQPVIKAFERAATGATLEAGNNEIKTGKPPYMLTWDELEPSIDAQVYVVRNARGEKNYRQWKEAHFEAVKEAVERGWRVPDKVLYDYPSLIRSDLNDNDADLASDAMVETYQRTKDYAKAVQAYRDWAPGVDLKGFEQTKDRGNFRLDDDDFTVLVERTKTWDGKDRYRARLKNSTTSSGPNLTEQQAIDWAANLRDDLRKAEEAKPAPAVTQSPPVLAGSFSAMRGHVEDGRRVLLSGDRIVTVKSSMNGWELRDEAGALVSGPHKSAQAIETAVVAMDAATPSAAAPAERPDIAAIRRDATLDKQTSENGEVMTRRQWVERKVADGLKPKVEQEDRIKPMSRMQFFRASNEEQRAHERKIKEAGKKDVYWIGDYEVTKTEHDYAVTLLGASPAQATAPAAAPETPAWHTPLPEQGEPVTDRDRTYPENPRSAIDSRRVVMRLAGEAVDAVSQTQKMAVQDFIPWVLPTTNDRNGVVRLLPPDQKPGAPWQQMGEDPIKVGLITREQAVGRLAERLRSAPIVASDDTPPPGPKTLKERVEAKKQGEQAVINDRDHFTLERGTSDNQMEQVTFARGEYITYRVGEGGPWAFGEIDGISHARREFSVDGLWHPFGFAYKAERPPEAKKNTVPMSSVVDEVNAKNGDGLTTADAVSPLQAFKDTIRDVYDGKASVEVYRAAYQRVRDAAAVKAELGKMTKEELTKTFGILRDGKKDELVDIAYESMLRQFALRKEYGPNSYTMTRGGYENYLKLKAEALDALVAGQTAEDLAAFADERKRAREADQEGRAKLAESTKNPKTLEDFRRYIRVKESEGKTFAEARMMLTPEQRALMDDLAATETRSRRTTAKDEQRTQVRVAGQTVDGQIIATKHTKKGHDLYVVKLAERVSREDYDTLNAGAKRIGGYYSSFRGGGAIPGFQFTTREQAEAFVKLAGGDNAAAQEAAQERRNAYEDDRSQTVAERLTEMADRMEEDADESLARDRKVNTTRRARFAASAEQSAREAKAMAKTMRNIAQALTSGAAKFLDRVRTKTQIELLQTYVANAKDAELRAKYPSYAEQEKRKGQPPTAETADYAEFPTFTAYRSDLASLGRQLLEVDGTKKLGERIMKVADDVSEAFTAWVKEPGNFYKVSTFSSKSGGVAAFSSKDQAERAIARSGYRGKAIPWSIKRGEWTVIMSPSEAMARGIWKGDGDKRITLDPDFGVELVEKMGRANRRGARVAVPWQFERAHERRKQLSRMGLETPAEFRAALREFIGLREQAAEADRIKALERAMIGKAKDGLDFFPTPESVADEMIAAANIKPDMAVLEPSAGMGHIADRIRAAGAEPDVIELAADRRELLQEKGYHMAPVSDFLALKPREFFTWGDVFRAPDGTEGVMMGGGGMGSNRVMLRPLLEDGTLDMRRGEWYDRDELMGVRHRGSDSGYDRIVMNPPFSNGRDIDHVRHAYTLLKPGGRLVALMGESAFTNQNKKAAEFREWLDSVGGSDEKLAEGSFMDPSLPVNTGANARMVVIDKPESGVSMSRAPRVTVSTDPDTGAPTFHADTLDIAFPQATARMEFIDAGQVVNYAIMAPDSMEVYGFVELVIGDDGMPTALADIEVKPEYRGQGIGEQAVAAILAANPGSDLGISNIVDGARGFWDRMGVPEQNRASGEAYDGTLNWETYSQAADARGTGRDAGARGQARQASIFDAEAGTRQGTRAAPPRRVGSDAAALRELIAQSGVENVNVVQSVGDLPASKRDAILAREPSGRVRGAFFRDDGSIWLVADNLAGPAEVAFVLMHEAFHRGLAKTLGADAKRLLRQMYLTNPRLNKLTRDLMAQHGIGEAEAIEEALADLAGEGRARDLRGWDRFMAMIRDWLAKLGDVLGVDLRWSDDMIEDFVAGIRKIGLEGGVHVDAGASLSRPLRRGSEQDAIAAGYTMKAYRGVSAANPFNDTGTTWLTTSREVAEVYANEVMGYDDPDVLTVMVRPDDLPRRDASRLTDEEREGLQADEFGNPQAIGIYDRSDDHPLGGSRRNVTVIHAPQEAVWLVDDTVALSRAPAANPSTWESVRDAKLPAGYIVNDFIAKHGKLSWWSKTVGTMHNLAQRSPEFKRVYDAVQNFLGDVSLYATEAADLAPTLLPKLETFRDITKSPLSAEDTKAIAAPIFEGTLSWTRDENGEPVREDDPQAAGIVWTDDELRQRFRLNGRQIGLYREFRAAVDKSLTDLAVSDMLRYAGRDADPVRAQVLASESAGEAASILQEHLAALAETAGKDRAATLSETGATIGDKAAQAERLIQRGYAPLTRFGHYTLDVVDENGDRVYFGLFESEAEANRMARKLREGFPGAQVTQGTLSERAYQIFAGVSPETLELFGNLLGLESQGDDAASLAFQEYLKLAKSNRSALKRLIERKGIAGFSEDAGRVLAGFVYSNARQTAKNLHFGAITEATQAIADTKGKGELLDAAVDLHQYVTNPREEAQKIKGLLFAQFLGGSIASAMVNLTQPVAVAFPYLSQWGGASKAARRVTAALKDALAWETASPSNRTTGDKALDAAMKRAEEEGIVSPQEVHQLIAQAGGSGALEAGDGTVWGDALAKASNFRSKFMLAWGRPFSLAEQFNRRATYIAAYRTAVEEGQSDPAGFAKQAIADTMFTYNRGNRPAWARGAIGGTLFTFKTYSISYVELMARLAQSGPEGRKAALIGLATLMLMSGLQGLPGAEDLDDLIDGAMQRLGYNWSTKTAKREFFASILGEDGARFVMTGLSGLPGAPIDVSGRLGLGNFIPGTGLLTKKDDYTRDALEILGPVGSLAKQFGTAAGKIAEGDVVAGIKAALPVAAANAVKAADMASMGMYRDDRGRKVIDTDGADAFWKAIGFQPTDVAKVQDASFDVQRMVSQTRLREAEIADKWARGMFEGDQDLIDEARAELSRWNESNPSTRIRITSKQLLDRVKNMRMDKTERIAKTAPREIRETVRRELERTQ